MEVKFVGVVTEIADENNLVFRSDNKLDCQLQQVVGINIDSDFYVLASINKIDVNYFINNSKEYFTTLASLNKLSDLSTGTRAPKYSHQITASYIGIYRYNDQLERFEEAETSVNIFTPQIFQKVVSFNFKSVESVYGLVDDISNSFYIGRLLYPKYSNAYDLPTVNVPIDTFNNHSLISGVTGSGKSRLAALIMNKIALNGGHVTVIDPHNEYAKLALKKDINIYHFSNNLQLLEKYNKISYREIVLTSKYLLPQVLVRLLPGLTNTQQTYIYDVYKSITNEKNYSSNRLSVRKYIDTIIGDFNEEYKNYGYSVDKLKEAQEYAKKDYSDYLAFTKRYISYLDKEMRVMGSASKVHVIFAVLKKMIEIYEDRIFQENNPNFPIPAWLDQNNRNVINIFNLDYDENDQIRRHLNAIMSCFFIPQENKENNFRLLLIEEAHLLLKENDTTGTKELLSRLLRESRKYGVSIIFLTQNEEDVPDNIKSQFQNKFRFREENNDKIKFINNQTCICSLYKGKLSFPLRVENINEDLS